jgi:TonB family protein
VSAKGVPIPLNSVAIGMVELHVTIGRTGKVKQIQVVRELASVTEVSIQAVKSWEFAPATLNGKPIASRLTVAVVFCPYVGLQPIPLPPVETGSKDEASGADLPLTPPEIIAAQFPQDFNARTSSGTVVLQVVIGPDGQQGLVKVIRGKDPMTGAALEAVKDWKFTPASIGSEKVGSGIVLAFDYRPPVIYNSN